MKTISYILGAILALCVGISFGSLFCVLIHILAERGII